MNKPLSERDTRSMLRRYVLGATIGVFAICAAFNISSAANAVVYQRASCERANDIRVSELRQRRNLVANATARAKDPATADEGRAALVRANARLRELIDSQADVAVEPGSVVADCKRAWPMPWPLNIIAKL